MTRCTAPGCRLYVDPDYGDTCTLHGMFPPKPVPSPAARRIAEAQAREPFGAYLKRLHAEQN